MKKTIFSVFTRSIICVLTVLAPAKAQDFLDDQHVSARVSGRFDHADFQLNVMEADYGPAKDAQATHLALSQKKVVIKCWKGCDAAPDYVEDYEYIPIAAFRFGDLLPQFIVIGASASAYHVDIYQLSRKEIHKVLDQPTKAIPQFIFTKKGPPALILSVMDWKTNAQGSLERADYDVSWIWNGIIYEKEPNAAFLGKGQ